MESSLFPKKIRLDLSDNNSFRTCQHYVKRKKRFCKMIVGKNKEFCGEHEPIIEDKNGNCENNRIACPLDPKHTVYRNKIEKHLKICNSRPKENLPLYIKPRINDGSSDDEDNTMTYNSDSIQIKHIKLLDIPDEELFSLITKIEKIYKEFIENQIEEEIFKHDILCDELERTQHGQEAVKHLSQTSSLLGYFEKLGFLKNKTSFIEFGAGKGQVSYWLTNLIKTRTKDLSQTNVILIDRASLRHKKDNKLDNQVPVHRIRADICDFVINELEYSKCMENVVAFGKHLCGAATDLMLRCLLHHNSDQNIHFIVSLCCHHRCEWKSFVGKKFLQTNGINSKEFEIMIKMVSWAICGTGMSREKRKQIALNGEDNKITDKLLYKISRERKLEIGKMCKLIIDYARLTHMKSQGYESELKFYVAKEITLENICLIGTKINKNNL